MTRGYACLGTDEVEEQQQQDGRNRYGGRQTQLRNTLLKNKIVGIES
jgi:hypothetical protein